jgi:hypothetical protein
LVKQVQKQWTDATSEGVSKWLFVGQLGASIGIALYSYSVRNWVFMITNTLLIINNVIGIYLYFRYRNN